MNFYYLIIFGGIYEKSITGSRIGCIDGDACHGRGCGNAGGKIDRVDEVLYGSVQSGSLIGRADQADNVIYGVGNTSASGLDHRIDNLYADVVRNDNDRTPAISNRMNAMEYYLTDEISTDNLTVRMDNLEKRCWAKRRRGLWMNVCRAWSRQSMETSTMK